LAGLELTTLERVTALEQRVKELESALAATR
jgi:BMFP domain-containing protein YqiC